MNLFYVSIPNDYPHPNSHYKNSILGCLTYNREPLKDVIHINDLTGLWGFGQGLVNDREYNKINIGDVIFFRINTHVDGKKYQAFDGFGFISDKLSDYSIAKKVWGEDTYGEHLLVIDRYYRFYEPFLLSVNKDIVANIDGVPKEIWHKQYNMFRQWNMPEGTAKRLIDYFINEKFSINLYDKDKKFSAESDDAYSATLGNADQETETVVKQKKRKGQAKFRRDLLSLTNECEICGVNDEKLLIAGHIKSWEDSDNRERLDTNNGLVLCAIHDKLFDKGLISFSNDGNIKISPDLSKKNKDILRLSSKISIKLNARKKQYMKYHRNNYGYGED